MKTRFHGILTLFLAFVVQVSFAQEKTVSGTVSDKDDVLPGVNVLIKGTSKGVDTDFDGKYTIKVQVGDILVFSYLGYETVEKIIGRETVININLKESGEVLDEIVITGYSTSTKRAYAGTATTIKAEVLDEKNFSNISQALTGEVAGVNVINTSGQPGTVAPIRIRGYGSVNGNRAPLYVVDGAPYTGSINAINPSDIASNTILKDATATAI